MRGSPAVDVAIGVALVLGGAAAAYRFGGAMDPAPRLPAPGSAEPVILAPIARSSSCVRLLFAGAGARRRVAGHVAVTTPGGAFAGIEPVGLPAGAVKKDAARLEIDAETRPGEAVGVIVRVTPPEATLVWELRLEGQPLAGQRVFAGPYGLVMPVLAGGLSSARAWRGAWSPGPIEIDAAREIGLFVTTGCDEDPDRAPGRP